MLLCVCYAMPRGKCPRFDCGLFMWKHAVLWSPMCHTFYVVQHGVEALYCCADTRRTKKKWCKLWSHIKPYLQYQVAVNMPEQRQSEQYISACWVNYGNLIDTMSTLVELVLQYISSLEFGVKIEYILYIYSQLGKFRNSDFSLLQPDDCHFSRSSSHATLTRYLNEFQMICKHEKLSN